LPTCCAIKPLQWAYEYTWENTPCLSAPLAVVTCHRPQAVHQPITEIHVTL